ncbi:MAG: SDR family oxidoreductase [Oscillospiraceae bacterium]|nr:SDR family oxidoreductase [Oscillospiraceae bacterium]
MLQGKVAIITGASRGIGRATAELFVKNGASVVITGRDESQLREVTDGLNKDGEKRCVYLVGDSKDLSLPKRLFDLALEEFNKLDIIVCNAGMALRKPTLEMPIEEWNEVLEVNLTAPLVMAMTCLPHFRKQKYGKIVFTLSGAAKNPHLGASPSYGASKAALMYVTRHLAKEFIPENIYVNAVCPGPVDTDITHTWSAEHRARVVDNQLMGRLGMPEEIAAPILFLCSDASSYIVGECIAVNGGGSMD